MTGWDELTIDALRAEVDSYLGQTEGRADDGWRTMAELSAQFDVNRHTMGVMLASLIDKGRVELGERAARRLDGVRCHKRVYRLVEAER